MVIGAVDWRIEDDEMRAFVQTGNGKEQRCTWTPQPGSQDVFLRCPIDEVLYEGTRGPGKTDALIMDFAQNTGPDLRTKQEIESGVPQIAGFGPEWKGILFRQTFPQLADLITKTQKWYPQLFPGIKFTESGGKPTWTWPTGEKLILAYGLKERDYLNFHGHQYPWLGFEELTNWTDSKFFKKMFSCNRNPAVPPALIRIRSTTNPYGPGHNWVKKRYRLPVAPGGIRGDLVVDDRKDIKEKEREPDRIAIHGYLDENKVFLHSDPGYKGRIRAAASNPAELAAWLDGNWDIVAGGMFDDVWDASEHVVINLINHIPRTWRIDRSFDWGSSAPFSVGWWAESDGTDITLPNGQVASTVRGDLFRIAEWYGAKEVGDHWEGMRMLAVDITKGIIEREMDWGLRGRVQPGVADSAIFSVENGVSIAIDMQKSVLVRNKKYPGITWLPADKRPGSRKTGWELMRKYFKGAKRTGMPRELPGLFVCEQCRHFRRTIPVLPRDIEKDPDDVDTTSEDHIADEVRYRVRFSGLRAQSGRTIGLGS